MKRKSGRPSILRRIEELETRLTDGSGLVPHSPQWLAFWMRQYYLMETGQKHVQLTLDAVRAIMNAIPDDYYEDDPERTSASLVERAESVAART